MDTIYYTLNTRRVKVSGGADLLTFVPAPAPAPQPAPAPVQAERGQVLDFARCRQRLETREAWKELSRTAEAVSFSDEAPEEIPAAAAVRRERRESRLDLVVSVALLLTAAAAAVAFLQLL